MKILKFIKQNVLSILTLFLLAFIPLYPKIPLLDVQNTWVYVRLEDLIVAGVLTLWIFLVLFKKVKLKTPLTIPIFLFWVIGAISTFHGVLILFPTLPNVFSNVAFLSFIRRLEYLSLFFIAFVAVKDKRFIYPVIGTLTATLLLIVFYGLGQRFLGFPAYLTGNEEFAKGTAIQLSNLARIPSTFAGHYDLAAYLVLVIPIFTSLAFAFRNIFIKLFFFATAALGFGLLYLTVSRVSFFVLLISLLGLLILAKKKLFAISLLTLAFVFLIFSPSLLSRFQNTVSDVNVLVNAKTGEAISGVKEVSREHFKDKVILIEYAATESAQLAGSLNIMPYKDIPEKTFILIRPNSPTGENLPQGTGYVNLQLSPVLKRTSLYFTENKPDRVGDKTSEIRAFTGNFLVKKARAFDLSFTTRFQGEWPKTIDAFKRNIFLGSGYGSVSLAVDNNYLRILGETGLFGFFSFISLFLVAGIYIRETYPKVDSLVVKNLTLGFIAGSFGLLLNGILIDVFEASKIAFSYWLLMGVILGLLHLFSKDVKINLSQEIVKAITSSYAIILYLFIITVAVFSPLYGNYFVGDDFTWLRWAQDSQNVFRNFIDSDGFFYRPGARLYFLLMYKLFWLNETFYHLVSIFLHFAVASLLFILLKRIFKDYVLAILASLLFLILSGHHEAVFWISATGFLFSSIFILLSLISFSYWKDNQKGRFLALSLVFIALSFLFHEVGVVAPLLVIVYDLVFGERPVRLFNKSYLFLLFPLLPYFALRFISQSHWFSGDYSYNFIKLPFNFIGNSLGYLFLDLLGPQSISFYEVLRSFLRQNIVLSGFVSLLIIFLILILYKKVFRKLSEWDQKIIAFGLLFFVISLLPFLGLGNISSRYSYLSSIGFVIVFVFLVKKTFTFVNLIADRYTTLMIGLLLSTIFLSMQLFQLQNIHSDWKISGETVKRFLVSFEDVFLLTQYGTYKNYNKDEKRHLYFVDVPIRKGEAWIFPVGLKDALWFALDNKNFTTESLSNLNDALYKAEVNINSDVFIFEKDGTVRKVFKINNDIMILPKKE